MVYFHPYINYDFHFIGFHEARDCSNEHCMKTCRVEFHPRKLRIFENTLLLVVTHLAIVIAKLFFLVY